MRVGVYQNAPVFGEVEQNTDKALQDISSSEVDLLVLPELFNTGYQFVSRKEVEALAEEIPSGKTCGSMAALAREREMFLVFGLAEREGSRIYNSAAIIGPGGFVGTYRKTHLFAEEKYFFDPGDTGFQVFDIGMARIGVMICFDWFFPESARVLSLLGADIICHPANLVLPHCQEAMRTRSLENRIFSLTANRIGIESRGGKEPLRFTGKSQILDSMGRGISIMGEDETGTVIAEIEPLEARDKRITLQNDRFKDRRPEFYGPLVGEP
jgi:predicted amidohydrolase